MAKLVLSLNGTVVNQYFIDQAPLRIGRDPGNDIVIGDPLLSREHARIVSFGEDHIVEDLQSSNGTGVNGSPVLRKILQHRDIIELGSHRLCYLNTRMAAEVDLERTMLIQVPAQAAESPPGAPVVVPAMRAAKTWLPPGYIKVLSGSGRHAADDLVPLDRVVTTFGVPGEDLVVVGRRPQGYFLTHVEGPKFPRVNQRAITAEPYPLRHGDVIEAAGYRLEFHFDAAANQTPAAS